MDKHINIYLEPHEMDAGEQLIIHIAGYYERIKNHQINRQGATCIDEAIFIYCLEGAGWLRTEHHTYAVEEGMAIFCDRHAPHAYGSNPQNPWTLLWVHFGGDFVTYFSEAIQSNHKCRVLSLGHPRKITPYMEQIVQLLSTANPLNRLTAYSYLKVCLCEVLINEQENSMKSMTANTYVNKSIRYMEQRIHHALSLDELCHQIGISKYYFSRQFKKATGLPPMTYFNRLKIQKACDLLLSNGYPIQEISSMLGFSTPYYFSETFKQYTGFSPRAYRKRHTKTL